MRTFEGFEGIAKKFPNVRITGKSARARCPAHQSERSRSRSLALRELADGSIQITCFGGCSHAEILKSVGLHYTDLLPDHMRHSRSHHLKPQFEGWPCLQTLDALMVEINVVRIAAGRLADGGSLTPDDYRTLKRAHFVISDAASKVNREMRQ